MGSDRPGPARESDWERSERLSFWVALAIALGPIPASLLIAWALGDPPWRPRAEPARDVTRPAEAPEHGPGPRPHR